MIDGKGYLTVQQAAERKGVPVGTVESAISRGALAAIKDKDLNRRLLTPDVVDAWTVSTVGGIRKGAGRPRTRKPDQVQQESKEGEG